MIQHIELLETISRLLSSSPHGKMYNLPKDVRKLLFIILVLLLGNKNTIESYCALFSIPLVGGHVDSHFK